MARAFDVKFAVLGCLALTGTLLSASPAQAQSCATNAECPQGFACEVTAVSGCAGMACPDGQECPEPPPCEPQEYRSCMPGPCSSDTDCADGMVCYTQTFESCSTSPACPPGSDCTEPDPDPVTCTTTTSSQCTPRYALPCSTAADCGDGFECVPLEECACSGGGSGGGSAGSPTPDPAPAPPEEGGGTEPVDGSCTCTPSGVSVCQLIRTACTDHTQCLDGWLCTADPSAPTGSSGGCSAPADGSEPVCWVDEPAPVETICLPPNYQYSYPVGGVPEGQPVSGGTTSGESADDGNAGATPERATSTDSGDMAATGGGGCQLSPGGAGAPAGFALLALAASWLFRRRRHS
jgi:MYXO-CTERM domain-containing protein